MIIDNVLNTIEKYDLIQHGETIVIGISGGPDSVCLLHVLHSLSPKLGIKLFAVHINHMLRGEESDCDTQYVRTFCENLSIPLRVKAFDIKQISKERGISLEEAGREIRYALFEEIATQIGATKIAVAHNKNDQVETVLMRIIRGTGLDGLKGMNYRRDKIIRPLLDVERRDIEKYCSNNLLNPRIDSSNLENIYTRNRVRLDLIPCINNWFGMDITDNIYKMANLIRDDNEFIESVTINIYNECIIKKETTEVWLDIPKLQKNHIAAVKRVLRNAIKYVKGNLTGLENVHIEKVIELILDGKTGAELHLPSGVRVSKSYSLLKFSIYKTQNVGVIFDVSIKIPGITSIEALGSSIEAIILDVSEKNVEQYKNIAYNCLEQFFDLDKLKEGINIRNRREGDVFKPYKSNGTKKLKEYFIDNKVPREKRDKIPLIAKDSEIIWILGHKISDKFKVTENTKSVLILKVF